jgi:hypothetical protein
MRETLFAGISIKISFDRLRMAGKGQASVGWMQPTS